MKSILLALLPCLLMCSCQGTYDVGLKSQVEVAGAKRVAVCQSGSLDRASISGSEGVSAVFLRRSKEVTLPENSTARALVSALPAGIEGKVIQGLKKPRIPANQVVAPFRNADYASVYEPIPPMPGVDLVIQVCPRTVSSVATGGGGYYNSAAGVYISVPGGSQVVEDPRAGGYGGGYNGFPRTVTMASMLDIYVYRGVDGKCLGSFYLSFPRVTKVADIQTVVLNHVAATADRIMERIFGR
ncbi:MAG: hypothetical protein V4662_08465 [Verrucomicrobiota bacterium]